MIDGGPPSDDLSQDEIRELLREDLAEGETGDLRAAPLREAPLRETLAIAPRLLVVSRKGVDAELLRGRLEARGARLFSVRNPFTALDQLRRAPFDGIVSDLDLWANDGSLLLERIRALGRRIPVLFITDRGHDARGNLGDRLTQAGAWGILYRPLRPADLEGAAQSFLADLGGRREDARRAADAAAPPETGQAASAGWDARGPAGDAGGLGSSDDLGEGKDAAQGAARAVGEMPTVGEMPAEMPGELPGEKRGQPGSVPAAGRGRDIPEDGAPEPGEILWLRFFYHATRGLRAETDPEARMRKIARLALEHLRPKAAGVVYRAGGLEQAYFLGASGESLEEALATAASGAPDAEGAGDGLAIRFPGGALILLRLPRAAREKAAEYLDEARRLLESSTD